MDRDPTHGLTQNFDALMQLTTAPLQVLEGLGFLPPPLLLLLSLPLSPPPSLSRRRRRCRLLWLPTPSLLLLSRRLLPLTPSRSLWRRGLQVETPAWRKEEEDRRGTPRRHPSARSQVETPARVKEEDAQASFLRGALARVPADGRTQIVRIAPPPSPFLNTFETSRPGAPFRLPRDLDRRDTPSTRLEKSVARRAGAPLRGLRVPPRGGAPLKVPRVWLPRRREIGATVLVLQPVRRPPTIPEPPCLAARAPPRLLT